MPLFINRYHRFKMTSSAHQVRHVIWGSPSTSFALILLINENKIILLLYLQQWPKLSDIPKIFSASLLDLIFPLYICCPVFLLLAAF